MSLAGCVPLREVPGNVTRCYATGCVPHRYVTDLVVYLVVMMLDILVLKATIADMVMVYLLLAAWG